MANIAFLTYTGQPEIQANDQLAANELIQRGNSVDACVWDDETVDWKEYDLLVVRSNWDYHFKIKQWLAFLDYLKSIDANLWNPVETIKWNVDKKYLLDLKNNGILIPETTWIERGGQVDIQSLLNEKSWDQAVVKPTQSATAHNTWLVTRENTAKIQEAFDIIISRKPMMIQAFMKEIAIEGEWSFIFINNEYSHSVLKKPANGDFRVQSDFGGTVEATEPKKHFIEEAEAVLYSIPMKHLYARVDAVISDGALFLMELELIEPQLFLSKANGSVDRFVRALLLK